MAPDDLWTIEVFRSHEAKDAYENSPLADQLRDEIHRLIGVAHLSDVQRRGIRPGQIPGVDHCCALSFAMQS